MLKEYALHGIQDVVELKCDRSSKIARNCYQQQGICKNIGGFL